MFYKKVDKSSNKAMYEFLAGHNIYPTFNSWNGLSSISHNVKVYNLAGLKYDPYVVLGALEDDEYFSINQEIQEWELNHEGYEVYFNGRSGGHLVLTNKNSHDYLFGSLTPHNYDTYEDFKEDVIYNYGSLKNFRSELLRQVNIVQDFDKLCDDLIEICNAITKYYLEAKAQEEDDLAHTKEFKVKLTLEEYQYPDKESMRLHKKKMLQLKYTIYDADEDDLWIRYEVNKNITDSVIDK